MAKKTSNNRTLYSLLTVVVFNLMIVRNHEKKPGIIYILHWTTADLRHYITWKLKRKSFTIKNCYYQNCYLTEDKDYFDDFISFDAILYNSIYIFKGNLEFPPNRADDQIYIFVSMESAVNYPVHYGDTFDWFFNYTWTYKLTSDIPYPYLIVRNKSSGEVIGPKQHVQWLEVDKMGTLIEGVKERLQKKKTAVAWIASNCMARYERNNFVANLREALGYYNFELDIYGGCGFLDCPKEDMDKCLDKIESDYFFYLAFENSFSEDYVSEKLLTALEHFAVPIVMGGADYSRFMPNGIYINALQFTEEDLAKKIYEVINDKNVYYDYFKWHKYYSFHESSESEDTDPLCALCAFLNGNWREKRRVYAKFTTWWNEMQHVAPQVVTNGTIVEFDVGERYILTRNSGARDLNGVEGVINALNQFVDDVSNYFFS